MTRQGFPGGSYPDALPTGERVVLYHGRFLEAHFGVVAFPAGETFGTMFNRIAPDGRRFAGLRHDGGGLVECVAGAWRDVPGPFAGSSPLIYDLNGALIHDPIVYADGSVSSQGYRYIDERTNTPVTGQDTYATPDGQINQFSVYRGVVFGQGHEGGLVVRGPDGITRLLAPESPFDIRVQGIGPVVAVSFWDAQRDGLCAYIYIGTLAEYLALPPVAAPVIAPIPPVVTPKPEPQRMTLPANVKQIRDRFVAQYPVPQMAGPGPSDDAFENVCRAWCYKLAQTVVAITGDQRWGVKNAGGGRPQSKDTLALDGPALVVFDLLGGVGTGHPTLVADPQGEEVTGQAFMPVEPVNWLAGTQPAPQPQPSDPGGVSGEVVAALKAEIAALKLRIEALETRKFVIAVVPQ